MVFRLKMLKILFLKESKHDELVKAKNRDELLKSFGAVKVWINGVDTVNNEDKK